MSMREQMAKYLSAYKRWKEAKAEIERHTKIREACGLEMASLQKELEVSVQPRCGSATQPSRRIYTDGQYTTLIVEWDDKFSRPSFTVQEPEQ